MAHLASLAAPSTLAIWRDSEGLKDRGIAGAAKITKPEYGLRELVVTDPDGNRIRLGSPDR